MQCEWELHLPPVKVQHPAPPLSGAARGSVETDSATSTCALPHPPRRGVCRSRLRADRCPPLPGNGSDCSTTATTRRLRCA